MINNSGKCSSLPISAPTRRPSRKRNNDDLLICDVAWIVSGPRLVPIQVTLSEAVYVILRTQCHEVLVLRSGRP
jgi:hypothetical protein